tara:strand:+ start:441 stop:620 length:180 start_codon:yes stop_codon:yes gene_type:complete
MELDQTQIMNEYVSKQNKLIGELINKNLMLDSQLAVAMNHIRSLEEKQEKKSKDDTGYK